MNGFRLPLLLLSSAGLALAGCGDESTAPEPEAVGLVIVTASPSYGAGDTVVVLATNKSDLELHVSMRQFALEVWAEGSWEVAIETPEDESCGPFITVLRPGNGYVISLVLPDEIPAGEYRYRFRCVDDSDGNLLPLVDRVSRTFRIEA